MKRSVLSLTLVFVLLVLFTLAPVGPSLAGRTERVLIEFAPGRAVAVRGALESAGGTIHYQFDELNVLAVTLPATALKGIARNPNVVAVEPDVPRYPMGQTVPWGIDAVQAPLVWDDGYTGGGVTVCIIDSGLYTGHEDFGFGPGRVSGYPSDWNQDACGHGTHVAGTIAAADNDLGVVGVAPGVGSLFIVKVFGDDCGWAYSSTLIDATNQCKEAGADIISMSLGGPKGLRPEQRQFDKLWDQGILSIAAAGNAGTTAFEYPASYDSVVSVAATDIDNAVADFSQQNDQVELAAPGVDVLSTVPWIATDELTVDGTTYIANHIEYAATNLTVSGELVDGGLCDSTGSWGDKVVLCERGDISFYDKVMNVQNSGGAAAVIYNNEPGNFLGTLGDGASSAIVAISLSQEDGQWLVTNKLGSTGYVASSISKPDSGYESWQGTSMATPHVSGVAALLWSSDPTLTNADIRDAMDATALDLGVAGRDNAYGYGLVQAYDALLYLGGGSGENQPPVASFTYSCTDLACDFDASGSDDPDGSIVDYAWDFGDTNSGSGETASHTYNEAETYNVTLTVTDNEGATDSASHDVTVSSGGGGSTMYVLAIDMTDSSRGRNRSATADVTVYDTDGNPVVGAMVHGTWSGAYSASDVTDETDANGVATFTSGSVKASSATFTFTVDNIIKSGYTYDSTRNLETSDTITVP